MIVSESQNKNLWEQFNQSHKTGSLLQSWDWAEFQSGRQQKIWRLEVKENGKIVAQMFLWKHGFLYAQNALYAPRGPVIIDEYAHDEKKLEEILKALFDYVHQLARKNKSLFFRLDPAVILNLDKMKNKQTWQENFAVDENKIWPIVFEKLNFEKSKRQVQPAHTIMLDLSKSEQELLQNMHQKTRYNIRLAKKRGVEIIESADVKAFFRLMKQTIARQKFVSYPKDYFENLLKILKPNEQAKLYLAKYQGKIIAGILCTYYKNTATYLFGASSDEYKNIMAPHLLQWNAILKAKEDGYLFYDFWGAAPEKTKIKQEKSWLGITRFKQGFDPNQTIFEYVGAYSFIYRPMILKIWEILYQIYRKIKI